ncbi:WD40-repeat-containing domain protein [Absidia repens]|uniref:WD40-repeat-containing domain protein n=1 Tax=Absidia repens TaxID=90262 RepID=A0A1X2I9Q2_9FUNG|nr:WD40-repeat-containing domain protein [Absidia repens]
MSTTPPTTTCYRHRPELAKNKSEPTFDLSLDTVSSGDRAAITHVWSLFSSAPKKQRDLILKGILSVCCMPQLSFIYESLQPLLRIDFVSIFPKHVNFKIFGYLDAVSLCQAAQVSHAWKFIADDERLWYIMCDQHTGKTCVKCGWGLPNKLKMTTVSTPPVLPSLYQTNKLLHYQQIQSTTSPPTISTNSTQQNVFTKVDHIVSSAEPSLATSSIPALSSTKRKHSPEPGLLGQFSRKKQHQIPPVAKTASISVHSTGEAINTLINDTTANDDDNDQFLHGNDIPRNNWKSLYRERMIVEQNWRQNRFILRNLADNGGDSGTKNGVICIQVCNDLQVIMIGYDNNLIQVYDGESNINAQQPCGEPTTTMALTSSLKCFQFDEAKLIVGESDHSISIWDWHQGTRIRTLQGHTGAVIALHFNKRNLLATGSMDQTIRLWDFGASQSFVLLGHHSPIRSLLLQQLDQQQLLVSSGDDQVIRIWDLTSRQCIRSLTGHNGGVLKMVPIPRLAMTQLLSLAPNNEHHQITNLQQIDDISDISNYSLILSCSSDNTIKLWDIRTGKCIRTMFGHMDHVTTLACDQFRIISGSKDRTLRIWSLNTGICQHAMALEHAVDTVALSSSGILSASNGVGCIWDYSSKVNK